LLNPFVLGTYHRDKVSILDVKARDAQGKLYNVEIQCKLHLSFPERILYYGARLFSSQLQEGHAYLRLKPVISVIFTDFELLEQTKRYHSTFRLTEQNEGFLLTDALEIHILELPKFAATFPKGEDLLGRWLLFLLEGKTMNRETIKTWNAPEIEKAFKELEELSRDQDLRWVYEDRYKALMDHFSSLQEHFDKGLQQGEEIGLQKGREEGREEGALSASRQLLLRQLEKKFPTLAQQQNLGAQIEQITELEVLSRLLDALFECDDPQQMLQQLENASSLARQTSEPHQH
jgi:predicted transposase/invertase (TIGR01784 family)